jgi:general secretion pathway protein K
MPDRNFPEFGSSMLGVRAAKRKAEAMKRNRSEEGIALIAVLWALTLLSLVAAALIVETRTSTRVARNMADTAAARAAADAGIQRAILDLIAPKANKTFRADGMVYGWHFADSTVRISVQDVRGKVNLNRAQEGPLAALFSVGGVDPGTAQSLADAVADFRDVDDVKHRHGAERAEYRAAGLAWGPKNAPFQTVDELEQVLGMTAEIYERVATDLTIYTGAAGSEYVPGYRIRADARSSNGGVFVREAMVLAIPEPSSVPVRFFSWQQRP